MRALGLEPRRRIREERLFIIEAKLVPRPDSEAFGTSLDQYPGASGSSSTESPPPRMTPHPSPFGAPNAKVDAATFNGIGSDG